MVVHIPWFHFLQHSLKIRVSDVCFTIFIVYVDIIAMTVIALVAFLWP